MLTTNEKVQLEKTQAFFKKAWQFILKYNVGTTIAWIIIIGVNIFYITSIVNHEPEKENDSNIGKKAVKKDCNAVAIDISGYITSNGINGDTGFFSSSGDTTYSDAIKYLLDTVKEDDDIKAVLLNINSYGGDAGSAQEIVYALENFGKPIVAVIRSAGTSAGYWVATLADKIYAYETADVGGIGITMSHLDETAVNTREGKVFVSLSIGKYKDMSNPDKSLTVEEKVLLMRDIKDVYNIFVRQVSENRGLPIEDVKNIADGSSMIAQRAKEKGLIDEIGSSYDAIDYMSSLIGEAPTICTRNDGVWSEE